MSQSILAKVGINALVDEATGYQNVRDTNALSELLKLYVAEDLLRRESGFPKQYYQELERLHGFDCYTEETYKQALCNAFTDKYVYDFVIHAHASDGDGTASKELMDKKIIDGEIQPDTLVHHVIKMVTIMTLSKDLSDFEENFKRVFNVLTL